MIEELIDLLHSGGYSCAIANGDIIRTFTQRGVADLYDLLTCLLYTSPSPRDA